MFAFKNNTDDISNYVIECDSIPVWRANTNYSAIIPEFTMMVDDAVTEALIEEDQAIDVYYDDDTYPFFTGYVVRKQYKLERRAYQVTVLHQLGKLKDHYITYSTLHATLAAGATAQQYLNPDNQGYPSTQLVWVLKKMFSIAGLILDTQDVDNVLIETIVAGGLDRDILFQHLRLDENMLYAVNQPVASVHGTYDGSFDYQANRLTFWDFVSAICSYVSNFYGLDVSDQLKASGLILRNTISTDTSPTAKAVRLLFGENTLYNITSGAITKYDEDTIKPDGSEALVEILTGISRADYTSVSETNLYSTTHSIGDSNEKVNLYSNLLLIYETFWTGAGYTGSNALTAVPPFWVNALCQKVFKYDTVKASLAPIDISMALYAKSLWLDVQTNSVEFEQELVQEVTGL